MANSVSLLPKGYKELKYIQSTGTQWIKTDVIPKNTWDFNLILSNLVQLNGSYKSGALFGNKWETSGIFEQITTRYSPVKLDTGYWHGMGGSQVNEILVNSDEIQNCHFGNGYKICNGVWQIGTKNLTKTATAPLCLMAIDGGPSDVLCAIVKIKRFVIREGFSETTEGIILHDLVPCLNKRKVPCLYDLMTGKEYKSQTDPFLYE
jgi:hypothetical protein